MKKKGFSYAKWGYIFAVPFMVAWLVFMLYPVLYTLFIGFTDLQGIIHPVTKILPDPLENYKSILASTTFKNALKTTFIMWIWNFIPQISLALLLAAWFSNDRMKIIGKGFFKVVFYMPNIITAASIAILFGALFGYPVGPANDLLMTLKLLDKPFMFSESGTAARLIVAFIQFWTWYGYTMIVLISGILGISPELFEAADIDGANGIQKFLFVTIPNLKTILLYTLITSLIGGLQMFDIPKLFLNGGPHGMTKTTSVLIYELAFGPKNMYNRAAAASMVMFVIIAVLSIIIFFMMRDRDEAASYRKRKKQEKEYKAKLKALQAEQGVR